MSNKPQDKSRGESQGEPKLSEVKTGKRKYTVYTDEQKRQAAIRFREGISFHSAARELGINPSTLSGWYKAWYEGRSPDRKVPLESVSSEYPTSEYPKPEEFVEAFIQRLYKMKQELDEKQTLIASLQEQIKELRGRMGKMTKVYNDRVYTDKSWKEQLQAMEEVVRGK